MTAPTRAGGRSLRLTGQAIDDIKRHQAEDRGAWYDYDEDDYERKLQRAIVDRDMLLAELERLYGIVEALEADYERQCAILVSLAQQGLVHMTGASTTTADSSARESGEHVGGGGA